MTTTHILTNGRLYTMDDQQPTASAVAIRDGRILAVGDDQSIKPLLAGDGEWIDLGGRCVTPGLVDAHVHFRGFALHLQRLDLDGVGSLTEALDRVAAYQHRHPGDSDAWLLGRGWTQDAWVERAFPTAADLDRVVAHRPLSLHHKSGHALWVNSKAMQLAGIYAGTADPPGGSIQRDADGRPTGIFFEEAIGLVTDHVPGSSLEEVVQAMSRAQDHCWQAGLTGIHDFDGVDCFQALQTLCERGKSGLRFVKNIPVSAIDHAVGVGLRSGFGDDWLRIGGVKIFADGALGPRTAAMIAPYENEPANPGANTGIVVTDKEAMIEYGQQAGANGLSLTVHAIGDRANHDVLDVVEVLRREESNSHRQGRLRHRIEHAQVLHPADFERLAKLGVIASMQPTHATSDMLMAGRYWGDRAKDSYAWRTVLNKGALLVFGSDAPVERIEPLLGLHAAVTRRRADGSPGVAGWYPEQKLTMTEAVHAFTLAAALTSGQEKHQGSITPGKLADLTIFERDLFTIPPAELLDVAIAGTMVGGIFRYRNL